MSLGRMRGSKCIASTREFIESENEHLLVHPVRSD